LYRIIGFSGISGATAEGRFYSNDKTGKITAQWHRGAEAQRHRGAMAQRVKRVMVSNKQTIKRSNNLIKQIRNGNNYFKES